MKQLIANLWFDTQAEEAAKFYCSIFKDSKLGTITHYSEKVAEVAKMPAGSVLTVQFEIMGQKFIALNGGPAFKLTEAFSLMIPVDSQEELDYYWNALSTNGGEESYCGWLKDKFGLSWQVGPAKLEEWMRDPVGGERVMAAIMDMRKLDYGALERAYNGS
jgi:predicted 3-demethylubiquinone-9 3-methyltransferase (glyoxalase superfamily)